MLLTKERGNYCKTGKKENKKKRKQRTSRKRGLALRKLKLSVVVEELL